MENSIGIVNKVEESGLITFNLESYFPTEPILVFDLKGFLFRELILKEKDFRAALKELDWSVYNGALVALTCSVDAIIPYWAYMLVTAYLEPVCKLVVCGTANQLIEQQYQSSLAKIDWSIYKDQRMVIKGCGDKPVPIGAYVEVTRYLRPLAKSILYGEPCSTVPVYKKPMSSASATLG